VFKVLVTVRSDHKCEPVVALIAFDTAELADRAVDNIMNAQHRKDPCLTIYAIPLYKKPS
jgi:hypothetical protein